MATIEVSDGTFYYEDDDFHDPWTPCETIILQHGLGRSSRFWTRWVPPLACEYRVIRRDLRGFGRSSDPGPNYQWSLDGQVADLCAFLDALDLPKVHYLGESIGGVIGLAFASKYPHRFQTLTLCSTPTHSIKEPRQPAHAAVDRSAQAVAPETLELLIRERIRAGVFVALDPVHKEWIVREGMKNRTHVWYPLRELLSNFDITGLLAGIQVPTLILAPTNSIIAPYRQQEEMASLMPRARLAKINGRGHEIYVEQSERCIAAFREMLADYPMGLSEDHGT